ncbi:imidazole glycerol phosphate synthase subunit HisF [Helicovermis profundi]|uniref:Imidazole glycerol phosphate synthase subunit HisF n=1 Tax=Helicovermis profundi TaxID=3065157 RepID=A0AAU9EMS4_9FIRM|nr:imidazole glycerol phosphate synthase subunit HisF [Clostridia bacterium S502]
MIAKRIIPCLDVKNGMVVKGQKFANLKTIDDPVKLGKYYSENGADELVLYDITATNENRNIFTDIIKEVAKNINIPFTIGGGIRTIEDFTRVLYSGADKVSINSAAILNPSLITQASKKFGNQCVVLSMDIKKYTQGSWDVYLNGGRKKTNLDAIEWAIKGVSLGAGEIVINSIDSDGVKNGYDNEITSIISKAVNVPIIASGGAGTMEHFKDAIKIGKADGVLAASVFHNKEIKIVDLKNYLKENSINVRL